MIRSFPAHVNREPIEITRREEINFCRYRLDVLLRAPEQNKNVIEAIETRLKSLQAA